MSNNIYRVPALFGLHKLILTNCAPGTAYRGAGRPNVSYLWERLVDEAARVTGIDRVRLRRKNMLPKSAFPYKTPTAFTYDCADPATLLSTALQAAEWDKFPARRREAKRRGKLRGIGLSLFIEPSGGVGKEEIAIRFGATARFHSTHWPVRPDRVTRPCTPKSLPRCSVSMPKRLRCTPAIRPVPNSPAQERSVRVRS